MLMLLFTDLNGAISRTEVGRLSVDTSIVHVDVIKTVSVSGLSVVFTNGRGDTAVTVHLVSQDVFHYDVQPAAAEAVKKWDGRRSSMGSLGRVRVTTLQFGGSFLKT